MMEWLRIENWLRKYPIRWSYVNSKSPPLLPSKPLTDLLSQNPGSLKGKGLKALEDKLDALLCAYMTLYFWTWRNERCELFGDLKTGYIIGPKTT